jgi:hypothetical protein
MSYLYMHLPASCHTILWSYSKYIQKNMISPCFQIVNSPPSQPSEECPLELIDEAIHVPVPWLTWRGTSSTGASWSGSVPTQMFTEKTVALEKKNTRKPPKTETTRNSLFTATKSNPTKVEKSSNIEAGKWGFVPTQSGIQP